MGEISSIAPLAQGMSGAAEGYAGYRSSIAQGGYQRRIANINTQFAQTQAAETVKVGEVNAQRQLVKGAQAASAQTADLARQGVNVGAGSAAQAATDIKELSAQDAQTIRNNAALEAWGFNIGAIDSTARGRMAYIAGRNQGTQSLISGGLKFARGMGASAYQADWFKRKPDWQSPDQGDQGYFPARPG